MSEKRCKYKKFSRKICKNCYHVAWTKDRARLPKIIYYCAFECKSETILFTTVNIIGERDICGNFIYPEDFIPKKVRTVRQIRKL